MRDLGILTWLSNFINYTIFAFISINLLSTSCFSLPQMLITAFGLFTSITVQLISIVIRRLN